MSPAPPCVQSTSQEGAPVRPTYFSTIFLSPPPPRLNILTTKLPHSNINRKKPPENQANYHSWQGIHTLLVLRPSLRPSLCSESPSQAWTGLAWPTCAWFRDGCKKGLSGPYIQQQHKRIIPLLPACLRLPPCPAHDCSMIACSYAGRP